MPERRPGDEQGYHRQPLTRIDHVEKAAQREQADRHQCRQRRPRVPQAGVVAQIVVVGAARRRRRDGDQQQQRHHQLAEGDDDTTDPTTPWPEDREVVSLGRMTLTEFAGAECDGMIFDPGRLPEGIERSEDPILHARSPAYSVSFERRTK